MAQLILIAHPSAELYGSDRVMLEAVAAMSDRGWQVVVTLPTGGPLVAEIEQRRGRVILCPVPVLRKSALRPKGLLNLVAEVLTRAPAVFRLIWTLKPDVVYVSTLTIPVWLVLARLQRRVTVCHVHESERTAAPAIRRALALPLLLASKIIVNSEFSRAALGESFKSFSARSEVIYNGVPGPPAGHVARNTLAPPFRLLFVGRLAPRKGPQLAIELVKLLGQRGVAVELDLVGAVFPGYEWFETDLRRTVDQGHLQNRIRFNGFQLDVWPYLEIADLVLVPSQGDEPFGNTAVEAILAARPVVVSANSGLDEAVAGFESAQRVPAANVSEWADAVIAVISDWPSYRLSAGRDAELAQARFAPEKFRQVISTRLISLAGSTGRN